MGNQSAQKKLAEGTFIPAMPLALNENRLLDERRQRALIRYYLDAGVGGLAVGVHTTQFAIRNANVGLYEPVFRLAMEEITKFEEQTGKIIVKVAGVCGEQEQAMQEALLAQKYGYDVALLSPGGLQHISEAEMLKRTQHVANILPVMGFYLQESVGGRRFSYNYWQKLCEIEGVVAIKAAPFNRYQTLDVVRAVAFSSRAEKIALYTGNDDHIVMDLLTTYRFLKDGKPVEIGFVGGLLGHWAVWTQPAVKYFHEIKAAKKSGDIPAHFLQLANEVTDANAAFFDAANNFKGCIAGLHEVLFRQGLLEGIWCLDKEETLSSGQKEEINRVFALYPYLQDTAFIQANIDRWFV